MRVLVIEDDAVTASYIKNGLTEEGHCVDVVADGRDGLIQATADDYDVMIVDRMLPGLDGLSLVRTLRGAGNPTPVLYLTSLGGVDDRVGHPRDVQVLEVEPADRGLRILRELLLR